MRPKFGLKNLLLSMAFIGIGLGGYKYGKDTVDKNAYTEGYLKAAHEQLEGYHKCCEDLHKARLSNLEMMEELYKLKGQITVEELVKHLNVDLLKTLDKILAEMQRHNPVKQ